MNPVYHPLFIRFRDFFYIRNHLPVPHIDEDEYELEITGLNVRETKLTLNDLKTKFPKVSVTATIMCAGNRRSEMSEVNSRSIVDENLFLDSLVGLAMINFLIKHRRKK